VLDYLEALPVGTLVGIDFGFSLPWAEQGALFVDVPHIVDAASLWSHVDMLCREDPDFYAGAVWQSDASAFRRYIHHHASGHRGEFYDRSRLRQCERQSGARPISIYHMTGTQVGAGSFAGMRILNAIKAKNRPDIAIWPFDSIGRQTVVIVEIYPSLFYVKKNFRRADLNKRLKDDQFFAYRDAVLQSYGADAGESGVRSVDGVDALVSAAALAAEAANTGSFDLPSDRKALMQREGWIFGVPVQNGMTS
ncbi:hypothetical protein, partial [Bradyrhizobium sp.]|uniref:hypothetical protein n=1 Tax=Bradyrhizobium sp. TaxID=376 RepID=UPI003C49788E